MTTPTPRTDVLRIYAEQMRRNKTTIAVEGCNADWMADRLCDLAAAQSELAAMKQRAEAAERKAEDNARLLTKINQVLLPEPHDEREVSPEWQVKAIRAAIAAKGEA